MTILGKALRLYREFPYLNRSFSQLGEDKLISLFMSKRKNGFYVDVGAHHPFALSNTYWAYRRGWHGINIEPNVDIISSFKKYRPNDITLNCGISDTDGSMKYYYYDRPALNTYDEEDVKKRKQPPKGSVNVPVRRLESILDENHVKHIDFMNVDVEGFEMKVLHSNNFDKYTPDYILIEVFAPKCEDIKESEVNNFLAEKGYICISKCHITALYVHKSCYDEYLTFVD